MLVAFILTYAGTRFYTRIGRKRGWGSGSVGGVHLHHLVPGVVMSLAAGALVIAFEPGGIPLGLLAVVFGAGAALTLDEFAMLLHLDRRLLDEGGAALDRRVPGSRRIPGARAASHVPFRTIRQRAR